LKGIPLQTFSLETLAAGECQRSMKKERKFKIKKLGPLAGQFAIVAIDNGNRIDESSEGNNLLVQQIVIAQ
jgi:hypothetical protein